MGSSIGELNPKHLGKKKTSVDLYGGKTPVCYMCSKTVNKKDYADIDIIIKPSGKASNDGLVIKTQVHDDCIFDFYTKIFEACGTTGRGKCDSVKKPKKSSGTTKRK